MNRGLQLGGCACYDETDWTGVLRRQSQARWRLKNRICSKSASVRGTHVLGIFFSCLFYSENYLNIWNMTDNVFFLSREWDMIMCNWKDIKRQCGPEKYRKYSRKIMTENKVGNIRKNQQRDTALLAPNHVPWDSLICRLSCRTWLQTLQLTRRNFVFQISPLKAGHLGKYCNLKNTIGIAVKFPTRRAFQISNTTSQSAFECAFLRSCAALTLPEFLR